MAANLYDTPTFNAAEYVAIHPDLQAWWAGTVPGSEGVKAEWHNDRNAWALDHWTTHGQAEGRQGRSSVYNPAAAASASSAATAAAAAKPSNNTWLLIALAAAAGLYFYYKNQSDKS